MNKEGDKFIYWTPRILTIMFILFLMLFSLDVITEGASLQDILLGLIMHNIPAFLLAAVLIISWRYEIVGGIAFILAGLAYIAVLLLSHFEMNMLAWILQISGTAFLIGILFLVGWRRKKMS